MHEYMGDAAGCCWATFDAALLSYTEALRYGQNPKARVPPLPLFYSTLGSSSLYSLFSRKNGGRTQERENRMREYPWRPAPPESSSHSRPGAEKIGSKKGKGVRRRKRSDKGDREKKRLRNKKKEKWGEKRRTAKKGA
jgi:hypothetical protein